MLKSLCLAFVLVLLLLMAGCAAMLRVSPPVLRLQGSDLVLQVGDIVDTHSKKIISFDGLISDLAVQQVVYVGETHSSANDHQIQLQVLEALYARNQDLLVGMEMFPRSVQHGLERWIRGDLGEREFLNQVDWMNNWGFPIELYRPILDFCRTNHVRIVGLNAPPPIVSSIARHGLGSLDPAQRAEVADDFDFSNQRHRDAIRQEYEQHKAMLKGVGGFDFFYQAQLAWEETMAETIAAQLSTLPPHGQVVVIIGNGHIEYHFGVPDRAERRIGHTFKTIVPIPSNTVERMIDPGLADYIWITAPEEKFHPHRKRLGVLVAPVEAGNGVKVVEVLPHSPAGLAGITPGDILTQIDQTAVTSAGDIRKALMLSGEGGKDRHRVYLQRNGEQLQLTVDISSEP